MITHVAWDFNGTLIDDTDVTLRSVNAVLRAQGLPVVDLPFYQAIVRFPVREYYALLGLDLQRTDFGALADIFTAHYNEHWREATVRPEVFQALEALAQAGIPCSILTAARSDEVRCQLDYFGLTRYFRRISGVDDNLGEGKAHLAAGHFAGLGVSPGDALLIGDSPHDAQVAQIAGCACALVTCGHFPAARLGAVTGAAVACDTLQALRIFKLA